MPVIFLTLGSNGYFLRLYILFNLAFIKNYKLFVSYYCYIIYVIKICRITSVSYVHISTFMLTVFKKKFTSESDTHLTLLSRKTVGVKKKKKKKREMRKNILDNKLREGVSRGRKEEREEGGEE